jgi:hypothetical protein
MSDASRRTLLGIGCAVIGGTLLSLKVPEAAEAQSESGGVFHASAFQWKPGTIGNSEGSSQERNWRFPGCNSRTSSDPRGPKYLSAREGLYVWRHQTRHEQRPIRRGEQAVLAAVEDRYASVFSREAKGAGAVMSQIQRH